EPVPRDAAGKRLRILRPVIALGDQTETKVRLSSSWMISRCKNAASPTDQPIGADQDFHSSCSLLFAPRISGYRTCASGCSKARGIARAVSVPPAMTAGDVPSTAFTAESGFPLGRLRKYRSGKLECGLQGHAFRGRWNRSWR